MFHLMGAVQYLWLTAIGTLAIKTAEMKWIESIFPGIGYDRYRLVEVSLPASDILVPQEAIEAVREVRQHASAWT